MTSESHPQAAVPWRPLYSTGFDLSRSRRTVNIRDMRHEDGVGDDPSHATGGMTAHEDAFPIPAAELQPRSYLERRQAHGLPVWRESTEETAHHLELIVGFCVLGL